LGFSRDNGGGSGCTDHIRRENPFLEKKDVAAPFLARLRDTQTKPGGDDKSSL
jgi:hypothetical protein